MVPTADDASTLLASRKTGGVWTGSLSAHQPGPTGVQAQIDAAAAREVAGLRRP